MAVVRKKWTKEEDEKILKEYKIKGAKQLQKELKDRTIAAIRYRYSYLTAIKPMEKQRKKRNIVDKCPFCGSRRINEVETWVNQAIIAFYCMNCLKEFTKYGDLIPPLYEGNAKDVIRREKIKD
jgi:DNA-directed RNA polymerase subunit RPC12/RpoP